MPAIMKVIAVTSGLPDSNPNKFYRGMIGSVARQNDPMGFMEMPINPLGTFTVQQINNSPSDPTIYSSIKVSGSGTVTKGAVNTPVEDGDVIVWVPSFLPSGELDPTGWYFDNYGNRTDVPDSWYVVNVTDKTYAEVSEYVQPFAKEVSYESLQYDPQTDNRRVRITNNSLTASGENGFTDAGTQEIVDYYDGTRVSWSTSELVLDAVLPPEEYEGFQNTVEALAYGDTYKARQWYITSAGMTEIENNGGYISWAAAELNPYLRNGILD